MAYRGALALSLLLILTSGTDAQPAAARDFEKAETHYLADELLAAEPLYLHCLQSPDITLRRNSSERLIMLYVRLTRPNRALVIAESYRPLLDPKVEPRRFRELSLLLGENYLALGHYGTARTHLEESLRDEGETGLTPLAALAARAFLARIAESRRETESARKLWSDVARRAGSLLNEPEKSLSPADRLQVSFALADSYRFLREPEKAIKLLEPLVKRYEGCKERGDRLALRDTLHRLASHRLAMPRTARSEHALAREHLEQAVAVHLEVEPKEKMREADLLRDLGDCLEKLNLLPPAERAHGQSVERYMEVLKDSGGKTGKTVIVFWKLKGLYEKNSLFRRAVDLAESQSDSWALGTPLHERLNAERGTLQVLLGYFGKARQPLRDAVAALEKEKPLDLVGLPRAYNNLALAELATGAIDEARELARKARELYRFHDLPPDDGLIETHAVRGLTSSMNGEYAAALEAFREGLAICTKLGPVVDPQHSHLLLNVALVFKAQGELGLALDACRKSHELYRRFAGTEALGHAYFLAALAAMHTTRGEYAEAVAGSERILTLCQKYDIRAGVLVVTARHCQALDRLQRLEAAPAEKDWRELLQIQKTAGDALFQPRTLNYLGLTAEMRRDDREAETLYREALTLLEKKPHALPGTRFISLWRLSGILDRRGEHAEARRLLVRGIEVAEATRLQLYGDSKQRAVFFAQFASAFEELVDRCVRDGELEEALLHAARGRSRAFLDQLQLCGVDPRKDVQGSDAADLLKRERELAERIGKIRAKAQFILVSDADEVAQGKTIRELTRQLEESQTAYAEVWREILNASPMYRQLASASPEQVLATIREKALKPDGRLLWYWVGRQRSYVFLIGPKKGAVEAFPLVMPTQAARDLTKMARSGEPYQTPTGRDLVLTRRKPGAGRRDPALVGERTALDQDLLGLLVDIYRGCLDDPKFVGRRDLVLTPKAGRSPPIRTGIEYFGHALLPEALRKSLRAAAANRVFVIPDGSLHGLPLEALVLEAGEKPRFVLDELPPLLYSPSAPALAFLLERPAAPMEGPRSLLTVGDVAYPQPAESKTPTTGQRDVAVGALGLRGQLPLLPHSGEESRLVRRLFDQEHTLAIEGKKATERAVTSALTGKRFVHLAAHGLADERLGNLFGALIFAPPESPTVADEDDGFLSLHEIYRLPLRDCELAVLSACQTNVGPRQPLEAGVTIAGAFLAAGARNVVASHWSVEDESTAELMTRFFEELRQPREVSPAMALHRARLKVRENRKWASPFHWSPFVLLGTGR